jgi:Holliday junction DNA helicase RuvA
MMLSSIRPDEISTAIIQGNIKLLESVKGIGKKTAERLVLELKDKVGKHSIGSVGTGFAVVNSIEQDALIALTSLGIAKIQAEQAIQKVLRTEADINNLEILIKKALKAI